MIYPRLEDEWIVEEGEMKTLWVTSRRVMFVLALSMVPLTPPGSAQILKTDFSNPSPSFSTTDPKWSSNVCGGQTFLQNRNPLFEWGPIFGDEFDTQLVGISGTIPADPTISGK